MCCRTCRLSENSCRATRRPGLKALAHRATRLSRSSTSSTWEINAGLADPRIKAGIADLGNAPLALSRDEYGKLLAEETEKWGKVIRAANIKPQ